MSTVEQGGHGNLLQQALRGLASTASTGMSPSMKPMSPLVKPMSPLLRLPSDAGDDEIFGNDAHSPRPHEAPTDLRGWYKLCLGKDVSSPRKCKSLSTEAESVHLIVNGARK
mmetsp:Transcript_23348/g.63073  ORF Transcript_23348/g.63073 Transcript_23348/m.63073 type:complete len:112 (-) Transcript_23348:247-582(-)